MHNALGRVGNGYIRFRPPFGIQPRWLPRPARAREPIRSVGGVPDDGEGVVIILPGGAAEIGVKPAWAELGGGKR